ncbi:MAG: chemotaxis protein CheA, partial [Planctomycetes bacterium]|nr:chemotaxis protein CheA [Planctomycetota bacterium]
GDKAGAAPSRNEAPAGGGGASATKASETIRVDLNRLDQLMNLGGELVINRARFARIRTQLVPAFSGQNIKYAVDALSDRLARVNEDVTQLTVSAGDRRIVAGLSETTRLMSQDLETVSEAVGRVHDCRGVVADFSEALHNLTRVSEGIQKGVMATRMVSIGPLFQRFRRVVRDMAKSTGKNVELVLRGEHTELDKRMIDELGDPLIHIIRNSADHGIELPDEREKAGKPREGIVTLHAFHRGNSIIIEVLDDGKGLDTDRIRQKCLEKGLLTEADVEKMTPHQIHQMIWEPGLSTAEKVTQVSGRGMGMDIVKSKIDELNGIVDVESMPGQGTIITIKLPLTLAILPSLLVDIRGDVFALPLETVSEIVTVGDDQLSTVQGQQMARVRGRVISLVRLRDVLSFNAAGDAAAADPSAETTLVIVGETGQEIGMVVDHVIGEEEIVIKSIAENYENVSGIAGASILGDGRVSLILDIPSLIERVSRKTVSATSSGNQR